VPHQLANAQLPLRATRWRIAMLFLPCHYSKTFDCHGRRVAAISLRTARIAILSGCPGTSPGVTVEIGGEKIRSHA
jgi:hypothetical protein